MIRGYYDTNHSFSPVVLLEFSEEINLSFRMASNCQKICDKQKYNIRINPNQNCQRDKDSHEGNVVEG